MANQDQDTKWSQLMERAQNGDGAAYQTLLREILGPIKSFCQKRIGYLGNSEDVVQEALLAIHKVRHTYDPTRRFCPWMFAIVRYTMIDNLRRHSRISKNEKVDSDGLEAFWVLDDPSDQREISAAISQALETLKPEYRSAFELTKIKGLSTKEAAVQLGIGESALKVRTHRAISMLRKILERKVLE